VKEKMGVISCQKRNWNYLLKTSKNYLSQNKNKKSLLVRDTSFKLINVLKEGVKWREIALTLASV